MPVAMGISCANCGRVYLVAHPDSARRIRLNYRDKFGPEYRLKCQCSAVRYFDKREMVPYSVSLFSLQRGYASRDNCVQVKQAAGFSKKPAAA
jgi:hypothetical protein